jgi:hypothetical protein
MGQAALSMDLLEGKSYRHKTPLSLLCCVDFQAYLLCVLGRLLDIERISIAPSSYQAFKLLPPSYPSLLPPLLERTDLGLTPGSSTLLLHLVLFLFR